MRFHLDDREYVLLPGLKRLQRLVLSVFAWGGLAVFCLALASGDGFLLRIAAAICGASAISYLLGRKGHTDQALALSLYVVAGCVFTSCYLYRGINDVGSASLPVLILVAGLMLNRRFVLSFCAVSILAAMSVAAARWWIARAVAFNASEARDVVLFSLICGLSATVTVKLAEHIGQNYKMLRWNEERQRIILQTAMDGFCLLDGQGRLLEANDAYCRMLGYSAEELRGKRISDLDAIETSERTADRIVGIVARGEDCFETVNRRKDGSLVDVEVSVKYRAPDERLVAFLRDITERKRSERRRALRDAILLIVNEPSGLTEALNRILALVKREARADAVALRLRAGDDFPYFLHDGFTSDFVRTENSLVSLAEDGSICRDEVGKVRLECTCGAVLSGGVAAGNPLFTSSGSFWTNDSPRLLDLTADEDLRVYPRNRCIHEGFGSVALVTIRANGEILGLLQLNFVRHDALTVEEVRFFEEICSVIGMSLKRKQAEEELQNANEELAHAVDVSQESELRFREIADTCPVIIWYGGQDMQITFLNKQAAAFTGREVEELCGGTWTDYVHPDDLPALRRTLSDAAENHRAIRTEFRLRRFDGEYRWVLDTGDPRFAGEQYLGHTGIVVDITDLKRKQEELLAAQKLESLGVLAGGIAHDFNNMLGAILAETELVLEEVSADSPIMEEVQNIRVVAVRAVEIVSQLLAYAGQEGTSFEAVDLSLLAGEMLQLMRTSVPKNARLETSLAGCLPAVRANSSQIRQIVMNLITNAAEALVEGGGVIRLTTALERRDRDYIRLEVSDTGCGMREETKVRIFDPFFSTKFVGRGLGLAAVQGIVRNHGGSIEVVSAVGHGTRIGVLLPCQGV